MNLNDKVIDDCAKGIELDPKYTKCYSRILKAYIVNGQFEKGLSYVTKAKENNLYDLESKDKVIQTMVNEIKEFYRLKESYDIAIDNYNKKSYSIACNYFNSLKDTCTKCDKIWLYLIECMIDSQKSFEVKDKIKMAVEKFPRISSDPNYIYFDAISDYFTGDLNTCKSKLDRLKLMDPSFVHLKSTLEYIDKAEDLKTKGNEAFKKGETEKAIELYNEALQLDSRNIEYNSKILGNRSACREKLKLYHQAYDDICESIEINENNAKSYLRRANILYHLEIYHESLQDYNKARQLDPYIQNMDEKIQYCNNKIKATKKKDLYDVLGVSKTATDNEIKKAWKKKSLSLHPDRMVGKSRSEKLIADKELRELNEANDILSDPKKRNQYDTNGFDEHGNVSEGCQGFNFGEGGMPGGIDISDIFQMFGGGMAGGMGGPGVRVNVGGMPGGFGGGSRSRRSGNGTTHFYM
eukprot:Mrub_02346.p1 GENE.Mrub_02346~~Mrub_02346.p1  ORF type:complete len:508 (-),score=106.64 Mrub_02346:224-1621(-)